MRIFHQHAKLEVTPGFKHAVSKVRLRQTQARLRFTYIELYLFIMPFLMTEEETGWDEEHYSGSTHLRAFSQSPGGSHSRSGRDPERTSVRELTDPGTDPGTGAVTGPGRELQVNLVSDMLYVLTLTVRVCTASPTNLHRLAISFLFEVMCL